MSPRKQSGGWKSGLSLAINVGLFAVAIIVLRRILTEYHLTDVVSSLHRIGYGYIAASLVLSALGYVSLIGYDYLSLRIATHPIPLATMWSASFISHAVQNSAPMSIVAGGGLRYRLFSRLGVSGSETAAVVAGNVFTFVIGLLLVAGSSFVVAPVKIPASFHLPVTSLRSVGVVMLALVAWVTAASWRGVGSVKVRRWTIRIPERRLLLAQLAVSTADWLLSSTALYVLFAAAGPVSFPLFLSGFLLTQIVTQVIPLPGGIGVFEAAILLLRPPGLAAPFATAALLVYRVVYYLIPLFIATALLALEAARKDKRQNTAAVRLTREIAPHLFALLTFLAGVMLLAFNTLPEGAGHLERLSSLLRLAVIEGSHFIGSLVGMGLLLLAFGLERRLRSAFRLTVGLLLIGVPAALFRAMDFVSAAALIALLMVLLIARREFNRTIPFSAAPINAGWVAAIVAAVTGIGWLGIYLQVRGEYTSSLWWRFALDQDAPRTLRVTLSVLMAVVIFVTARLVAGARRARARGRAHPRSGGPKEPPSTEARRGR